MSHASSQGGSVGGGGGGGGEEDEEEVVGRNGWVRVKGADGYVYYHNEVTAITQFAQPPDF